MSIYCREQALLEEVGLWWYVEQYYRTLFLLSRRAYDALHLAGVRPTREECEVTLAELIHRHEPMRQHLESTRYAIARELTIRAYLLKMARCVLHNYWNLIERPE